MPKKKKGAPRREMLLLCFLPALDVRRLKVCFMTLTCLQSIAAGLEIGHRVAEMMIPSAQGHGTGLGAAKSYWWWPLAMSGCICAPV